VTPTTFVLLCQYRCHLTSESSNKVKRHKLADYDEYISQLALASFRLSLKLGYCFTL